MTNRDHDTTGECDMLLMDYARGMLDEAQRVLVASYIEMSEHARASAALFEQIGGALMENCCEPVAMMEGSLHAVLGRVEGGEMETSCAVYAPRHNIRIPMPGPLCREISARCGEAAAWCRVWPGVRILHVPADDCSLTVVRMEPGARFLRHRHAVREITLVLDGAFSDAGGVHRAGDILIMDPGTIHAPRADGIRGCSCLIVSEDGRAAVLPWLMRLLRRP